MAWQVPHPTQQNISLILDPPRCHCIPKSVNCPISIYLSRTLHLYPWHVCARTHTRKADSLSLSSTCGERWKRGREAGFFPLPWAPPRPAAWRAAFRAFRTVTAAYLPFLSPRYIPPTLVGCCCRCSLYVSADAQSLGCAWEVKHAVSGWFGLEFFGAGGGAAGMRGLIGPWLGWIVAAG